MREVLTARQLALYEVIREFAWWNYGLDEVSELTDDVDTMDWAHDLAVELDGVGR